MVSKPVAIWRLLSERNREQKSCNILDQFKILGRVCVTVGILLNGQTDQAHFVLGASKVETIHPVMLRHVSPEHVCKIVRS
jgi:hypothetical protein